jgi:hypothetical protein
MVGPGTSSVKWHLMLEIARWASVTTPRQGAFICA